MHPLKTTAALVLSIFALARAVVAQPSLYDCAPGWEWTYNSFGQTPCMVDAYLVDACDGDCMCNTVMYSLASACGACASLVWTDWDTWYLKNNCTTLRVDLSYITIPTSTRIPQWAFSEVVGSWNSTLAEDIGDLPESTAGPAPTASASAPLSPPSAAPAPAHGLSRGAKAAIAGGAVGGVLALLLLLLLVSRRRARAARSRFRERVRARYFDMKVGPHGLESVRMQELGKGAVGAPPEKAAS